MVIELQGQMTMENTLRLDTALVNVCLLCQHSESMQGPMGASDQPCACHGEQDSLALRNADAQIPEQIVLSFCCLKLLQ